MVGWQRRKTAAPAAESAEDVEGQAQEVTEALIEGVAKEAGIAETLRAAADAAGKAPDPQLSVSTGEWDAPEMPGEGFAEGLGTFAGILSAVTAGLATGGMQGGLKARLQHRRQELLLQRIAGRPMKVSPAVSFAPGSCCVLVIQPGELTVLPCAGASPHDHPGVVLRPAIARAWARHFRAMPAPALTPGQTAAITAWTGRAGVRGPTVIVVSGSPSPANAHQDAPSDQPGHNHH